MTPRQKKEKPAAMLPDRVTQMLRLWASRYSQPIENLSAEKLVDLMQEFLSEKPGPVVPEKKTRKRWDHEVIETIISQGSAVLDLGCGNGSLLDRLIRTKNVHGQGVELDPLKVFECVARGVSVFQIDLDEGLTGFPDKFFDFVILEKTLQTVHQPVKVLSEMLRVGKQGIVSFPNFGYWKVRLDLAFGGRMPVLKPLPESWYETPNIHLFTIEDFMAWAGKSNVRINQGFVLAEGRVRPLEENDNLFAEEALVVVQGKD